jgi:glycine/D-amino acid oxidase-like deaminating enzyme
MPDSATEVRDLHGGTPIWPWRPIQSEPLLEPIKADVIVLGAGVTGAMVAEATTAAGLSTVVLDRRPLGFGSTAASTALLQFEIDTPLTQMVDEIGFENARRAWLRSYAAISDLERTVRTLRIDCAFRNRTALYLAGNELGPVQLADEARLRRRIGLPSLYLTGGELRAYAGIDRPAAVLSHGAADVDPVRLAAGCLDRAVARGARLYAPVNVAEVAPRDRDVQLVTDAGIEVAGRALVFATGYELADGVPSVGHRHTSTWAFATRPQVYNLWPQRDLIWEASDPYLYIRTTEDGRVIVGGEDEGLDDEQARDAATASKVAVLQAKAKALLPAIDVAAAFAWSGTFGESDNGLPSIGRVPGMPNCYAVLGYGGNGITFSVVAAQINQRLLCGQTDPDAGIFAFR